MDRRLMLGGLAALATSPVMAQTNPAPATNAPAAMAPAAAPAMKSDMPMTMSDAQMKHMKDTMRAGSMSLAISRIALPKLKHAKVKEFAEFEIAEQETIADILKAMQMPGAPPMGMVKAPTDAEVMANLDDKGKAAVEKMQGMKAGVAFDRDYIKAQIDGHKELLDIQQAYLKAPDNLDETNVAKLAKGMIKEHLTLLGDLEKMA